MFRKQSQIWKARPRSGTLAAKIHMFKLNRACKRSEFNRGASRVTSEPSRQPGQVFGIRSLVAQVEKHYYTRSPSKIGICCTVPSIPTPLTGPMYCLQPFHNTIPLCPRESKRRRYHITSKNTKCECHRGCTAQQHLPFLLPLFTSSSIVPSSP